MRTIVTGGAGFIGRHMVELLLAKGHHVLVIDNLMSGSINNLKTVVNHQNLKVTDVDVRDASTLNSLFKHIDWVFHFAGLADIVPSIDHPNEYYSTNVTGTFNVLEAARQNKVKRFIYASSSSSYGIPDSYPTAENAPIRSQYPYALTKRMGEELVMHWSQLYQLPAVSLRLFNVYGPRSRTTGAYGAVFGVFLAQKLKGKPFTVVGDGTQSRDFTYVIDVIHAFLKAAESDITNEFMNVGSGNHYSINKLVALLGGDVEYIPKRPGEPECTFAKIDKIKRLLEWEPHVSIEEGVTSMLKNIDDWQISPVWDSKSIQQATATWFRYLSPNNKY